MSGDYLCADGCGRKAHCQGYSMACYKRWLRAGRPEGGPPQPMTHAERTALSNSPHLAAVGYEPDAYDLAWPALERERRALRVKPAAADLIRCVRARDAEGIRLLLHRVTDWHALAIILAECADPSRTAAVCFARDATLAVPAHLARPGYDGTPGNAATILTRSGGESDAA